MDHEDFQTSPVLPLGRSLGSTSVVRETPHGALFVTRGRLEHLSADAYLIPTDCWGNIESAWEPVPQDFAQLLEHVHDSRDHLGQGEPVLVQDPRALMVVTDVAIQDEARDVNVLGQNLARALEALKAHLDSESLPDPRRRARPLLAMPVVGVGRGGYGRQSGRVVSVLLETLERHLSQSDCFDIVLVCLRPSDYGAVQYARARRHPGPDNDWIATLASHARSHSLSVLFGAGASATLGAPMWRGLLNDLATSLGFSDADAEALQSLDSVDAASILSRASTDEDFRRLVAEHVHVEQTSLTHSLIAAIDPSLAMTTNYDNAYERAVTSAYGSAPTLLPWMLPDEGASRVLLKLHGDAEQGLIVLARDDFVAMHAYRRPLAAVLQERMLSGHVLTLGSTLSDPTIVGAASEVAALMTQLRIDGHRGTAVFTEADPARTELLDSTFDVVYANEGTSSVLEASRRVDLLLDRVAMRSSAEWSFALNPAYEDLLDEADLPIVKQLRTTHHELRNTDHRTPLQEQLIASLATYGADDA